MYPKKDEIKNRIVQVMKQHDLLVKERSRLDHEIMKLQDELDILRRLDVFIQE